MIVRDGYRIMTTISGHRKGRRNVSTPSSETEPIRTTAGQHNLGPSHGTRDRSLNTQNDLRTLRPPLQAHFL